MVVVAKNDTYATEQFGEDAHGGGVPIRRQVKAGTVLRPGWTAPGADTQDQPVADENNLCPVVGGP